MNKHKIAVFLIIAVFLFGSCDEDQYYYHTAINYSATHTVTVNFNRVSDVIILAPGESKEVAFKKGTSGEFGIISYSPDKKVSVSYGNSTSECKFYDRKSYEVRILNLTGFAGTLSAEGWMDEINFIASSDEQSNVLWLLYNDKPKLTALTTDGYLLSVLYTRDGNIIKVTIMS